MSNLFLTSRLYLYKSSISKQPLKHEIESVAKRYGSCSIGGGEAKRCSFVRFENRQEIKCYIPISFFFAYGKRAEMPVDKGLKARSEVWKIFEVRY